MKGLRVGGCLGEAMPPGRVHGGNCKSSLAALLTGLSTLKT